MARVGHGDQVRAHTGAVQDVGDGQGLDLFEAVGQHDGDGGVGGKLLGSGHDSSFLTATTSVTSRLAQASPPRKRATASPRGGTRPQVSLGAQGFDRVLTRGSRGRDNAGDDGQADGDADQDERCHG